MWSRRGAGKYDAAVEPSDLRGGRLALIDTNTICAQKMDMKHDSISGMRLNYISQEKVALLCIRKEKQMYAAGPITVESQRGGADQE